MITFVSRDLEFYDGTWGFLVRVVSRVASAIGRAYESVHIVFDRRFKCFGNVSQYLRV